MSPYRRKEARREGPGLEALEHGVVEALPGLRVLDRLLEHEGATLAELAGVDPQGALVLVVAIREDDDSAAVRVLDALAFARENAALFPRHFDAPELSPDAPVRVCVVAPGPCPRLFGRLAPLVAEERADASVELFELRSLRSAGSEQTYLVRTAVRTERPRAEETGPETFLAALPDESRATAEDVLERMERMDQELVLAGEDDALTWSLGDELVARLDADRGRLRGAVPTLSQPLDVAEPEDVERFLGAAMGRFAALLDLGAGELEDADEPLGAVGAESWSAGARRSRGGRGGSGPGAEPAGGAAVEAILTPAEIEAFREL